MSGRVSCGARKLGDLGGAAVGQAGGEGEDEEAGWKGKPAPGRGGCARKFLRSVFSSRGGPPWNGSGGGAEGRRLPKGSSV
jgi:hypothetical protein